MDLRHRLALCCVSTHKLVIETAKRFYAAHKRHYYLTPSSYMDLMKTYDKMMTQTKQEFLVREFRLISNFEFFGFRRIIIDYQLVSRNYPMQMQV